MRIPPCARLRPRTSRPAHALRPARAALAVTVTGVLLAGSVAATAPAAGAATVSMASTTKTVTVTWRGNGHGHGMSQYGARGAAAAGLSYQQIIAFYYPHTTLVKRAQPIIRVLVAGFGPTTTVPALSDMGVNGVGRLPVAGIARWRLVADAHSGLTLQKLPTGAGARWTDYRTGLADGAGFNRGPQRVMRVYAPDGTSNLYNGDVRAVRTTATGAGPVQTVNAVALERYVAGVAPREMPASWARQAVDAQAIAARTYAQYAIDHAGSASWDICDTTACQFYGGAAYLDASGHAVWTADNNGAADTTGLIAQYRGSAIFAQFSASNGGWTVDGGQPYLVAKADPYDNGASGDPYLNLTNTVSLPALAHAFGLSSVSRIVTTTDGHGTWGGRTSAVTLLGVRAGKAARVQTTGFGLADALGAGTDWYQLVVH